MKKYIIVGVIAVISLTVAGCSINQVKNTKGDNSETVQTVQKVSEGSTAPSQSADLPKEQGANQPISYEGQDGQTALKLLQDSHQVKSENTSFGVLVQGIDGTFNANDQYWVFYVDGKQATVGSDSYVTKSSEQIEWRYEKMSF